MRKVSIVLGIAFFVALYSCSHPGSSSSRQLYVPFDPDTLLPTPPIVSPITAFVADGMLCVLKTSGSVTDTLGSIHEYNNVWEYASFSSPVGGVSVNSIPLTAIGGNTFYRPDTTYTWDSTSTNHWDVIAAGSMPAISENVVGTMPEFTGVLPTNISRSADLIINFSSTNTTDADQAYFMIYWDGHPAFSNVVNANGGVATMHLSTYATLANGYFSASHSLDMPCYGALIKIVVYSHTVQTISGKQFAFVKQHAYIGRITFY